VAQGNGDLGKLRDFDLLQAPGHLLRRNHQRSYEIFCRLVGTDVTRQQIALLIALCQNPGASQNLLVATTGFDKSTLKEMIDRLIARGWVERARDPEDSRSWVMHITEAGRSVLGERLDAVRAVQREILAPLPEPMRADFLRCLRILLGLEPPADE
jgi:DNA-binding MarR family transcriptional regulator